MKYTIEDTTLTAIADSIRAKTGGVDEIMPEDMPTEINGIETGGGTEEIENIIDNSGVLDSTEGTVEEKVEQLVDLGEDFNNYIGVSAKRKIFKSDYEGVQEEFVLPKTDFSSATSLHNFCINSYVTDIPFYIDSPNCTSIYAAFSGTSKLKHMVGMNTSKVTRSYNSFYNSALEVIDEPFDFSSIPDSNNTPNFNNCRNLREIRFVPESLPFGLSISASSLLSAESIQSIIDGLADLTGGTAQTLTLNATVKAKLTQTQLDTITGKNWSLA